MAQEGRRIAELKAQIEEKSAEHVAAQVTIVRLTMLLRELRGQGEVAAGLIQDNDMLLEVEKVSLRFLRTELDSLRAQLKVEEDA